MNREKWDLIDDDQSGDNVLVFDERRHDGIVHLPGLFLLDHTTVCGFVWPEGVKRTRRKATCHACIDSVKHAVDLWERRKELIGRSKRPPPDPRD